MACPLRTVRQSKGRSFPISVDIVCLLTYIVLMDTHFTFSPRAIRAGLCDWLAGDNFTHALTLNTDRDLTSNRLGQIFGNFCMNVDRSMHGRGRVRDLPTGERFHAIAFPEHLETNPHLHVAADLGFLLAANVPSHRIKRLVHCHWLKATRGAGSVVVELITDAGWARYQTKSLKGPDPLFFIAADYHPH